MSAAGKRGLSPIICLSINELEQGCKAFQEHERRDAMYKTATFLVNHFWLEPNQLANGLGVLLLTWNHAFYRYGMFDFEQLEGCISKNHNELSRMRHLNILDTVEKDERSIRLFFPEFLDALAISGGKKNGIKSPVAAAKALHLLAPNLFPLWDDKIARGYRCRYSENPAEAYLRFFNKMRMLVKSLPKEMPDGLKEKSTLKLIDEYNYSKFTKGWI